MIQIAIEINGSAEFVIPFNTKEVCDTVLLNYSKKIANDKIAHIEYLKNGFNGYIVTQENGYEFVTSWKEVAVLNEEELNNLMN